MDNVKDFVLAALPWVLMGVALAVVATLFARREKTGRKPVKETYMGEGVALGMLFGVAIGSSGVIDLSIGMSIGMMLGMVIGMSMEKKDKKAGTDREKDGTE